MEEIIETGRQLAIDYGLNLILAILTYVVGKWVSKILKKTVIKVMTRAKTDAILITFTSNLVYAALIVFVVIAALGQLGVQTTSFIAILGAAGLAVGLALQGSLSNFAAGVLMIIFRPFKVGDFIEAGGASGIVEGIDIFTTLIRTGDNKVIFIPNGSIMSDNIVNYSAKETRRIDMVVGIGYDADIKKAKDILTEIVNADERILKDPAVTIGVSELADSSVNIVLRPWVKSGDYWGVHFDLNETIKNRFDEASISIPYPQRDIHLFNHE
ncbi:MAG: mechanosensitive ion channel [Gammaproteobacteria bacterium]|nr:mechanosensitive ion channel [Gammaproteobacteria bacterium]MCW8983216.1 mechanosensitive ion channel [Gammaproteobacteria bacterium]